MTSPIILSLEQQLAALKAGAEVLTPVKEPTAVSAPVTVSLEDLRSMVKELIGEERKVKKVEDVIVSDIKEYTMLEAVNLALTGEEQRWLCKDDVIKGVANFMATDEGQVITKQFIIAYRNYYDS